MDCFYAFAAFVGGYVVWNACLLLLPVCVSAVCFHAFDCIHIGVETSEYKLIW